LRYVDEIVSGKVSSILTPADKVTVLGKGNWKNPAGVFKRKMQLASRLFDLASQIGWVVIVFGGVFPQQWFNKASSKEWEGLCRGICFKRHWIRETAKSILPTGCEWMFEFPSCKSSE
jgi:predicted small integral membrane protein